MNWSKLAKKYGLESENGDQIVIKETVAKNGINVLDHTGQSHLPKNGKKSINCKGMKSQFQ